MKSRLLHTQSVVSHVCSRVLELRGWKLHKGDKHKMWVPWKVCAQRHYRFFHLHVPSWIRTERKRYREASHGHTDCQSDIYSILFFPKPDALFFSTRMLGMWRWILQLDYKRALQKVERVCLISKINIDFDSSASCNSNVLIFILDANSPASKWMEPGHLTSFVTRNRMVSQDPSLQTPHQRKSFLSVYLWRPILHMRATEVTRCSPLQQHPLLESSSRRPAWNLPKWATSLVKQIFLTFYTQVNKVGGGN